MLELDSADSDNQVLTVLRSGKETSVVWTYSKKAVDGTVESTEAAEEPTKLLTVSMPLDLFKRAITQRGLSIEKFVKDFNINLLAVNFLWSDVPLLSVSAKIFSKNVVAVDDSGSSGVVISCGCVSCLGLKPDDLVEMNIASLNGVEKKSRSVFFDVPIEVGNSLVSLPALVADGLFVDVLLGANWLKAVGACLDVSWLELVVNLEKLKLKKLPDPSKDFVGSGFCMYASEMVEISPGATVKCGVVHVPVPKNELCFVNAKVGSGFTFDLFKESNKDGIINSLSIANKSDMPITIQRGQQVGSLYLVETVKIPGNVLSSSLSSSLNLSNKLSSSYFFVSNSFDFSSLFSSFCESEQER